MRWPISIFLLAGLYGVHAQNDSAKAFKGFNIQYEFAHINPAERNSLSISKYQALAPGNSIITKKFYGFGSNGFNQPVILHFNGFFSFKFSSEIKPGKNISTELSAGLRFGYATLSSLDLFKRTLTRQTDYSSTLSNDTLILRNYRDSIYSFSITGQKMGTPFGIHFAFNKPGYIWFIVGLEATPFISFSHYLNTYSSFYSYSLISKKNPGSNPQQNQQVSTYDITSRYHNTFLKGLGYGFYTALPASVNVRFSKYVKWLNNVCLTFSVYPTYAYSFYRFSRSTKGFTVFSSVGLKYNW